MPPITDISQLDLTRRYTYADYLTWQLTEWVELIRGKVRLMSPAPKRRHQDITRNVEFPIMRYLRGKTCKLYHAPFDVRLSRTTPNGDASIETVVQPDICVVCDPEKLDERGCVGAPDWIIEIVSPGNVARDTRDKLELYQEAGVREYWIILPEQQNVPWRVCSSTCWRMKITVRQPSRPWRVASSFSSCESGKVTDQTRNTAPDKTASGLTVRRIGKAIADDVCQLRAIFHALGEFDEHVRATGAMVQHAIPECHAGCVAVAMQYVVVQRIDDGRIAGTRAIQVGEFCAVDEALRDRRQRLARVADC